MSRILLPTVFLCLALLGGWRSLQAEALREETPDIQIGRIQWQQDTNFPKAPGSFPDTWISGLDCENDPRIQVHAYNDDTYLLRQSKCDTFEAPFMLLFFGEERILLMDTGALPGSPVFATANQVIRDWLMANGKDTLPLIVSHTHGHFDHVQSDFQFTSASYLEQLVGAGFNESIIDFWGFTDYPDDVPTIDLGGRVFDVLGTPGHHPASVTLYDRNTQLLFTGDIVYPGHLFVFSQPDWSDFKDSIQRLVDWAQEHPVISVVGCHIEMGQDGPYAYTTVEHPAEVPLEMPPTLLPVILQRSLEMRDDPECTIFKRFVIHPVYKCGITWNG